MQLGTTIERLTLTIKINPMRKIVFALTGVTLLFFSSCKKDNKEDTPTASDRSKADDAAARNEFNRIYDIAEEVFNSSEYDNSTGSRVAYTLPCGNVTLNAQNFTIDYSNSTTCGSRVLSGTVAVELQNGHTKFSEQGAVLKFTFTNYKVLYTSSNQTLTYNGTAYVTNTSGGKLLDLFTGAATIEHKVRADLDVTFDSTGTGSANVTRTWNVFRNKVFESTGAGTGISLTLNGDTSSTDDSYINGTYNNISEYGLNREGKKFINNVTQAFVWENCGTTVEGPYKLKTGEVTHTAYLGNLIPILYPDAYATFTAKAGVLGTAGTPVGAVVNNCTSNGYNVSWTIRNGVAGSATTVGSAFLPY